MFQTRVAPAPEASIVIDGDNYDEISEIINRAFEIPNMNFKIVVDLRELTLAELSQAWPFVKNALAASATRLHPQRHTLKVFAIMTAGVHTKRELHDRVTNYLRQKCGIRCHLDIVTDW